MQRLKRKFHDSKDENKPQDNPAKVVATLPIVTILLLKLQIYTILLLSFLPSTYTLESIRWILFQVLAILHKMARTMQVERLMPSDGSEDYTIISDDESMKRHQLKLKKTDQLRVHKTGLLDSTDSTLDELTEEEKHLKRLLDFVDNGTI